MGEPDCDPLLGISGKADQVMVRGQPKHVVGYLKEFLFDERQARAPVRSLSGGEEGAAFAGAADGAVLEPAGL